jgi:hypothetical protein
MATMVIARRRLVCPALADLAGGPGAEASFIVRAPVLSGLAAETMVSGTAD